MNHLIDIKLGSQISVPRSPSKTKLGSRKGSHITISFNNRKNDKDKNYETIDSKPNSYHTKSTVNTVRKHDKNYNLIGGQIDSVILSK